MADRMLKEKLKRRPVSNCWIENGLGRIVIAFC
jgi:hypothetical protein